MDQSRSPSPTLRRFLLQSLLTIHMLLPSNGLKMATPIRVSGRRRQSRCWDLCHGRGKFILSSRKWHVHECPEGVPPPLLCSPFPEGGGPCVVPQMERWNLILLAFSQNRIMCLISLQCKWKGEIHELVGGEGFQAVVWYPLAYINREIRVENTDKFRLRSPPAPQVATLSSSLSDKSMALSGRTIALTPGSQEPWA